MKRVTEDILLIFSGTAEVFGIFFLFLFNFNIDLPLNSVASHNKWQRFEFIIYFGAALHKNKYFLFINTCFIGFT